MSKGKKGKSGTDPAVKWDDGLVNEQLQSNQWQPFVALIEPGPQCSSIQVVEEIAAGVKSGCRRKFLLLTKENLLSCATEDSKSVPSSAAGGKKSKLGGAGAAATDKQLFTEVCRHVVDASKKGEEVPASLMARLIKYRILKQRSLDIAAKEKAKESQQSPKLAKAAGSAKKPAKKGRETPSVPSKSGLSEDIPMPQKTPTTMKKRGEEENDTKFIDDEPADGPTAYIILEGFTSVDIISELVNIAVPINVTVKVSAASGWNVPEQSQASLEGEGQEDEAMRKVSEIVKFWETLRHTVIATPSGSLMRNMAQVECACDKPSQLPEDKELSAVVFDQLAVLLYDVCNKYKQYQLYLHYLDLLPVPTGFAKPEERPYSSEEDSKLGSAGMGRCQSAVPSVVDMRYYNELLEAVPEPSIAHIVNCMTEQVCLSLFEGTSCQQAVSSNNCILDKDLSRQLNSILSTLSPVEPEMLKKDLQPSTPLTVVDWNSEPGHYPSSQPTTSTTSIKPPSLFTELLKVPVVPESICVQSQQQLQAIQHFSTLDDLHLSTFLPLLSLEHISPPLASQRPPQSLRVGGDLLYDYPLDLPVATSSTTALVPRDSLSSDIEESQPTLSLALPESFLSLDSYNTLEPLTRDVLITTLQSLQHTHPYISLLHHKLTSQLIIAMHTGCSGVGDKNIQTYKWTSHTHSKVGFGNYMRSIADQVGDIVSQAEIDDAILGKEIEAKCQQLLETRKASLEEQQKNESKPPSAKGKGKGASAASSAKATPLNKKHTTVLLQSDTPPSDPLLDIDLPHFEERKLFVGYDIGDRILQCTGLVSSVFTPDGARITAEQSNFDEGKKTMKVSLSVEDVIMSVAMIKQDKPPSPKQKDEVLETLEETSDESLASNPAPPPVPLKQPPSTVTLSYLEATIGQGIHLSLSHYGPKGNGCIAEVPFSTRQLAHVLSQVPPSESPLAQSRLASSHKLTKKQQEQQQQLLEQQQILEEKLKKEKQRLLKMANKEIEAIHEKYRTQQLYLTTPDGLHIVCFSLTSSSGTESCVGVTQKYIRSTGSKQSDSMSRTCLQDGSVVKEMSNGSMVLLCPDGRVYQSVPPTDMDQYRHLLISEQEEKVQPTGETDVKVPIVSTTSPSPNPSAPPADKELVWILTTPTGQKYLTRRVTKPRSSSTEHVEQDGISADASATEQDKEPDTQVQSHLLGTISVVTATDPKTKEVMVTREDNVITVHRPNGTSIVEHTDGTRITTGSESSVVIECPGFSRVAYQQSKCTVQLPGSILLSTKRGGGEYTIAGTSGSQLSIVSSGEVSYTVNKSSKTSPHYTLSHSSEQVLSATDSAGTVYTVDWTGQVVATTGRTSKKQPAQKSLPISCLSRFFLLGQDGSAYELHHKDSFNQIMEQMEQSPDAICMKETSPQNAAVQYSTIIKPCSCKQSSKEKLEPVYTEENFIPANLRVLRTTCAPPASCSKILNGHYRFGVGFGKDLNAKQPKRAQQKFIPPSCLQYRQFIHLSPLSADLRESLLKSIAQYVNWREQQKTSSNQLLPIDSRSSDEKQAACDVLEHVISVSEAKTSQKLHAAYEKAWQAIHCPPRTPTPPRLSKMPAAVKQLQQNIEESKVVKATIRNEVFPPYFQSQKGVGFLHSLSPDMDTLASKLPPHRPRKKSLVSFNVPSPSPQGAASPAHSPQGDTRLFPSGLSTPTTLGSTSIAVGVFDTDLASGSEANSPLPQSDSLSKLRPSNPTPIHAQGDGSPTQLRPMNPTPQRAAGIETSTNNSSDNVTLNTELEDPLADITNNDSAAIVYTPHLQATAPDLQERKAREEPNTKFLEVEEPVRRKINTLSTISHGLLTRGFELVPSEVDFGQLKEGCMYAAVVNIKNVGIDTCHFKVKPPPPSTGIKIFYTPGPVVAGLSRHIEVQVFAMAIGSTSHDQVGSLYHELMVTTETSILYLPIKACIHTADSFSRLHNHPADGTGNGVKLLISRPSSREDVTRPPKQH